MRRWLLWISVSFLAVDLALLGTVVYLERTHIGVLTSARQALYSEWVTDPAELELAPPELVGEGFLAVSPEQIAAWRARIEQIPAYREMLEHLSEAESTVEKAKRIALSFSRNGGEPYGQTADLEDKLNTISSPPQGYCNSHTEVFLALAAVAGIDAMEVVSGGHVTCDVYCPELKKWVWLDPQYALMARGANGEYLSGVELHQAFRKDESFEFEFFGLPVHKFSESSPRDYYLYDRDFFLTRFGMVWGNNVFTFDDYRQSLAFLPKAMRQLPLLMLGIQPRYRMLSDEGSSWLSVFWRQVVLVFAMLVLMVGTFIYPAYALCSFVRRRMRPKQPAPAVESTA